MGPINVVVISGRLATLPELKKTQEGKTIVTAMLAVERKGVSEKVDYITVTADEEAVADFFYKHFIKGQWILVKGTLQVNIVFDKRGYKHGVHEVIAEELSYCS